MRLRLLELVALLVNPARDGRLRQHPQLQQRGRHLLAALVLLLARLGAAIPLDHGLIQDLQRREAVHHILIDVSLFQHRMRLKLQQVHQQHQPAVHRVVPLPTLQPLLVLKLLVLRGLAALPSDLLIHEEHPVLRDASRQVHLVPLLAVRMEQRRLGLVALHARHRLKPDRAEPDLLCSAIIAPRRRQRIVVGVSIHQQVLLRQDEVALHPLIVEVRQKHLEITGEQPLVLLRRRHVTMPAG